MNAGAPGQSYASLSGQPLADILRLLRTPSIGPITFFHLLKRFGTAGNALAALPELSKKGGRAKPLIAAAPEQIAAEIEATDHFGARFILYGDPDYPTLLAQLTDAPPVLTALGDSQLWQSGTPLIAMVGARNASANGCQFSAQLARGLGSRGVVVVSGMARGIDAYAHRGSLATGTVAVIAGGIDNIYPPQNATLYNEIRERGAILSEQPFGQLPFTGSFPGRNRIIAGMTLGTVVVEASPKSGSLITARMAVENNRDVFAVPGSPMDPRARGCNQLIRQGAVMVENADDILQALHCEPSGMSEAIMPNAFESAATSPDDGALAEIRAQAIEKLSTTPVLIDELIEQCQTTATVMLTILLELELAGRVKRTAGNKVSLIPREEVA